MMTPPRLYADHLTRRHFLNRSVLSVGSMALTTLLQRDLAATIQQRAPRAKRVIYLFMSGGPSHVDLLDPKPLLKEYDGKPAPESLVKGIHFAQITRKSQRPLIKASPYPFQRYGQSGLPISSLMPHLGDVADEIAVVHSVRSEVFNHEPAVNLLNSGHSRMGRPSLGAWLSYGLGNENDQLPSFIVLTSGVKFQPLLDSYWTHGFLPSKHQGVEFRPEGDPILFLSNPSGVGTANRRRQLDLVKRMNERGHEVTSDPEVLTRIQQYEMAFRMQSAVPELTDLREESRETLALYGARPGARSFGNNCLLARRLVERGVRFVQLYDMGWDNHSVLEKELPRQCRGVDRGVTALIKDLKRRGLLDETLVIWGGEFGRTPVVEGGGHHWGRDHHPHGFTMWLAGGGIRGGVTHGETDEFGFHALEPHVSIHDLHATILHCLGIDHERFTFRTQGRDFRLTDVSGEVIQALLA